MWWSMLRGLSKRHAQSVSTKTMACFACCVCSPLTESRTNDRSNHLSSLEPHTEKRKDSSKRQERKWQNRDQDQQKPSSLIR